MDTDVSLALCEVEDEYAVICKYLALPALPGDLFSDEIMQVISSRIGDATLRQRSAQGSPLLDPLVHFPQSVNQLIDLPEDYSDLINSASKFT